MSPADTALCVASSWASGSGIQASTLLPHDIRGPRQEHRDRAGYAVLTVAYVGLQRCAAVALDMPPEAVVPERQGGPRTTDLARHRVRRLSLPKPAPTLDPPASYAHTAMTLEARLRGSVPGEARRVRLRS